MFKSFSLGLSKYAQFTGRSSRRQFWEFILATFVLGWIAARVHGADGAVSNILDLLMVVPTAAVAVRRLHDTGRSGWWLAMAPTGIGTIILIFMLAAKGQPFDNEYGPDPEAWKVDKDGLDYEEWPVNEEHGEKRRVLLSEKDLV